LGELAARLPSLRASWKPEPSVIVTSVGMISSIFGITRLENSTRAGIDIVPMIGPSTRPKNRSMPVHRPPPTTWKKSSAHWLLVAIATISPDHHDATTGSPPAGTI
jgi:hypothetical protein